MKLNKLFFIGLATLAFAACSNDDKGAGDGLTSGVPTTMSIKIDMVKTYATEGGLPVESVITGKVKVVIFSDAGLESATDVDVTGTTTAVVKTTSGNKLIYVLANTPTLDPAILFTVGMGKTAFEKQMLELPLTTVAADNNFFMTNVASPSVSTLLPNIVAPTTGNNVVDVKIGRVVAKIEAKVTAADGSHVGGTGVLSDIEYKLKNIAEQSYLVGQNIAGVISTPYTDGKAGKDPTTAGDPYLDYASDSDFAAITTLTPRYTLENKNLIANQGNTTRLTVKGVFTPNALVDAATGTGIGTAALDKSFWAVYAADGTLKGYTGELPTGTWAASPATIKARAKGECFYGIWIVNVDPVTTGVEKYVVVRNNVYKINIVDINGIGTELEDGDTTNPIDPIDSDTEMVAKLEILEWTIVDQSAILN